MNDLRIYWVFMVSLTVGMIIGIFLGIMYQIHNVSGFEMTDKLNKETFILEQCIKYHMDNEECSNIYGMVPFP